MKKSIITIFFILLIKISFGQAGLKEFRYWGVKFGLTSNFSLGLKDNPYTLIKTNFGDYIKNYRSRLSITEGGMFEIIYNFDSKNNKRGFVTGINIENLGYSFKYVSDTFNYYVNEQFRTTLVGIPFVLKYSSTHVYKNQTYFTFGAQINIFFLQQTIQKSSWNSSLYVANAPKEAATLTTLSLIAGYNYKIYFIRVNYFLNNFINKNYTTLIEEGTVKPYQHLNFSNQIYLTIGINIPMTRWLTTRSWTAEQIRRMLKTSKTY